MPAPLLTQANVLDIVTRLTSGESIRSVSQRYGVGYTTIGDIASGRTWAHLTHLQAPIESHPPRKWRACLLCEGMSWRVRGVECRGCGLRHRAESEPPVGAFLGREGNLARWIR